MTPKERKAILKAIRALDDWILTYAPECSSEKTVRTAIDRISDNGGTLAYATEVRTELEALLK